ncbi:HD domain-containing protein [Nitrolancea hollandica]|uniref:Metal dependent phosphohydrolase n=1 Tax=Nitrolancea hollandica Lb TaxID=1129897 RepID=I4EG91_9BACT|nr:HD domain-containing protein [Nitrolancea hollandica]CCF83703.1 Metal dependent phosphohydrolase [Nitrolancea hollandica Lb]
MRDEYPGTTIRDSLYDRIPLSGREIALLETPEFLRLDRIQQLGFVSKVWPGAKHTRFEHSLGVFHLMRRAIESVRRSGPGSKIDDQTAHTALAAALLHDIGHYPFSHAIEELGPPILAHEAVGRRLIERSRIAGVLVERWQVDPERVGWFVRPEGEGEPGDQLLRQLLSGPLDVDKLDYLPRDARHCNVPYGRVDTARLLGALRVTDVDGQPRVVVSEKGVSPLHSLINARQEMFDNVYWHHTNRACMIMLLRAVQEALLVGSLTPDALTLHDDASLVSVLSQPEMPESTRALVDRLRDRRLHKRAVEVSARSAELYRYLGALYPVPSQRRQVEIRMASQLAEELETPVEPYEILIDIPKPERWSTGVWVWFDRPPVGFQHLMRWDEVVGLGDEDFKRYEEHRRLIRIVTTERLREEVSRRWEHLLLPLMGTMAEPVSGQARSR